MAILEMGWTTDARPGSQYSWFAVDRDQQAKDLVAAFTCARQNWQPWIGVMTLWTLADPAWTPASEMYWWAINEPDGTPRAALNAVRTARINGSI